MNGAQQKGAVPSDNVVLLMPQIGRNLTAIRPTDVVSKILKVGHVWITLSISGTNVQVACR